jgi:hypothetical protein
LAGGKQLFDYGQTCENGLFGSSMDAASPRMGCSVVPPWDIKSPPPLPLLMFCFPHTKKSGRNIWPSEKMSLTLHIEKETS